MIFYSKNILFRALTQYLTVLTIKTTNLDYICTLLHFFFNKLNQQTYEKICHSQ